MPSIPETLWVRHAWDRILAEEDSRVVILTAGGAAREFWQARPRSWDTRRLIAVLDSDPRKHGTPFAHLAVRPMKDLCTLEPDRIVIPSGAFGDELVGFLKREHRDLVNRVLLRDAWSYRDDEWERLVNRCPPGRLALVCTEEGWQDLRERTCFIRALDRRGGKAFGAPEDACEAPIAWRPLAELASFRPEIVLLSAWGAGRRLLEPVERTAGIPMEEYAHAHYASLWLSPLLHREPFAPDRRFEPIVVLGSWGMSLWFVDCVLKADEDVSSLIPGEHAEWISSLRDPSGAETPEELSSGYDTLAQQWQTTRMFRRDIRWRYSPDIVTRARSVHLADTMLLYEDLWNSPACLRFPPASVVHLVAHPIAQIAEWLRGPSRAPHPSPAGPHCRQAISAYERLSGELGIPAGSTPKRVDWEMLPPHLQLAYLWRIHAQVAMGCLRRKTLAHRQALMRARDYPSSEGSMVRDALELVGRTVVRTELPEETTNRDHGGERPLSPAESASRRLTPLQIRQIWDLVGSTAEEVGFSKRLEGVGATPQA